MPRWWPSRDVGGGLHNSRGLNIAALMDARTQGAVSVTDAPLSGDVVTNEELLTLDVDVLIPAALDGVITHDNAADIRARIIVEGANGPTTPAADAILADRGITVVPDILANAGGVAVSYFEWVQDLQAYFWDEPEVNEKLSRVMHRTYKEVLAGAEQHQVGLRSAAQIIAVGRVAEAHLIRGLYP